MLAHELGVPFESLLVGCGADELIDLLMRCVLEPGDAIVDSPPTFTMYDFDARVNAAAVLTVPRLSPGFRMDVPAIAACVAANPRAKIVFVTSPNNPDGSVVSDAELEALLAIPNVLIVLDEAYVEFAEVREREGDRERGRERGRGGDARMQTHAQLHASVRKHAHIPCTAASTSCPRLLFIPPFPFLSFPFLSFGTPSHLI